MPKVLVFMAEGFEEMELTISVDVLRRAGTEVRTVSLGPDRNPVVGSRGIPMVPDLTLDQVDPAGCDMLLLPGGLEGTRRLAACDRLLELLQQAARQGKYLAAICAAPTVLVKAGLVQGRRVTSHPGVREQMTGVVYEEARVVKDGRIITSRAAGTTFEFAFALVEELFGTAKAAEVNLGVLARVDR